MLIGLEKIDSTPVFINTNAIATIEGSSFPKITMQNGNSFSVKESTFTIVAQIRRMEQHD